MPRVRDGEDQRSARQYQRAIRLMNALLDVVGADERHPLAGLLDVLADLVSAILNGKRAINARQASTLASRFGVSAAVFIA